MQAKETHLKGCFILEPRVFKDDRGYFFESYNHNVFSKITKTKIDFVQDNQASSTFGVVRGLHMQRGASAQTKLVRALTGRILDVAVDMRKDSPTYGEHIAVELNDENQRQLLVPKGFLHGYSVLSETALVAYKCDNLYDPESEDAAHPLDETIGIDWQIPIDAILLSEKDKLAKNFMDFSPVVL